MTSACTLHMMARTELFLKATGHTPSHGSGTQRCWEPLVRCSFAHRTHARLPSMRSRHARVSTIPLAGWFVSPVCFDAACQAASDEAFAATVAIPMLLAAAAAAYLARPVPESLKSSGKVFEDPNTGVVFETPKDSRPLRDKKGELVFRPISYTPWPVDEGYEGEVVRIDVGPSSEMQKRSYVFNKLRGPRSQLVLATLQRPLGVVFEQKKNSNLIVVAGFVPGSNAERARKLASLDGSKRDKCLIEGDVLRAVTTTNVVYPTNALFGMKPPQLHTVVYGADKQKFGAVMDAVKDIRGEGRTMATLVVERVERGVADEASSEPAANDTETLLATLTAQPAPETPLQRRDADSAAIDTSANS